MVDVTDGCACGALTMTSQPRHRLRRGRHEDNFPLSRDYNSWVVVVTPHPATIVTIIIILDRNHDVSRLFSVAGATRESDNPAMGRRAGGLWEFVEIYLAAGTIAGHSTRVSRGDGGLPREWNQDRECVGLARQIRNEIQHGEVLQQTTRASTDRWVCQIILRIIYIVSSFDGYVPWSFRRWKLSFCSW